jgi:hypothetical protein
MVIEGNVAFAPGITVFAGLSTGIGSALAFGMTFAAVAGMLVMAVSLLLFV